MLMKYRKAIFLGVIFLLATGIRLYDLTDEPLEFHITRQLRGAANARAIYLNDIPDADQALADFSSKQLDQAGLIEPPLQEYFTAQIYKLLGGEKVWAGRLVSIFFWLVGGWALFSLSKEISTFAGGVASLCFYLFLPFGILFSRALMPDPMMVASTAISIWALVHWEKNQTTKWAMITGLATGYAILSKSVAGFILIVPFAAFILATMGFKRAIRNKQVWWIVGLTALPNLAFYYYGVFVHGGLLSSFSARFFPQLLVDASFYVRWLDKIEFKIGLIVFLFGVIGIAVMEQKKYQWLLGGWLAGYFLYGFIFPYHIWTHDYYHLPLIPIVAAMLAPAVSHLNASLQKKEYPAARTAIMFAGLALVVGYNLWTVRVELAKTDYRDVATHWQSIAVIFEDFPDDSVIALTSDYGRQLAFYGNLGVGIWPRTGDLSLAKLSGKTYSFDQIWDNVLEQDYRFFLITAFKQLESQKQLRDHLADNYPVFDQGPGYLIYDLNVQK